MIRTLIIKEILGLMKSARVGLALILCFIAFGLNVVVLKDRYLIACNDFGKSLSQYNDAKSEASPVSSVEMFMVRRPSPLMVFFQPSFRQVTIDSKISEPSLLTLFPAMDYSLCAGLVLSLIALLLGYDAIAGERERGTLVLLIAGGLSKAAILFSKFMGIMIVITAMFLISTLAGILVAWSGGAALFSAGDWLCLALFVFSTLVYASVFAAASLFLSTLSSTSETALLSSIALWTVFVLIVPNGAPAFASISDKSVTMWDTKAQHDKMSDILTAQRDSLAAAYQTLRPHGDFWKWMLSDSSSMLKLTRQELDSDLAIDGRQRLAIANQMVAGFSSSRLSPYASFLWISQNLSSTGVADFRESARQLDEFSITWVTAWQIALFKGADRLRDMRSELPCFNYRILPPAKRVEDSLLDFGMLVCWGVLFFLSAYLYWVRKKEA